MLGGLLQAGMFHLPWLGGWLAHKSRVVAIAVAGILLALASEAAEYRLTEKGATLGSLFTDGKVVDLRLTVALDGDQAITSHVYAQVASAELRQRTNEGYWIPWDGNRDSLIDNRFPVEGDRIVYKVLDEDIGVENQGISIVIAYRTASAFKFGVFGVIPNSGG